MTALAYEQPRYVDLGGVKWSLGPAAELLRPALDPEETLLRWTREELARAKRLFDRYLLMASGKSNYREDKVKNGLLGAVAFGAPSTVYFALWTTAVATDHDASVGNTAGEVSGGSYDRVSKTNDTTNFPTVTAPTTKKNGTAITFPTASANWNSGSNINQVLAFDGNLKTAADNLELWGDLTTPKPVLNADTAQFAINAFTYDEA